MLMGVPGQGVCRDRGLAAGRGWNWGRGFRRKGEGGRETGVLRGKRESTPPSPLAPYCVRRAPAPSCRAPRIMFPPKDRSATAHASRKFLHPIDFRRFCIILRDLRGRAGGGAAGRRRGGLAHRRARRGGAGAREGARRLGDGGGRGGGA